jgi:hypothetical protein
MAQRLEHFSVNAPAGTASPGVFAALDFPDGFTIGFTIYLPSGHAGLTGIRLLHGLAQIVPRYGGTFLRGSDKTYTFEVADYPTGSGWRAQVFNTGAYDHRFECVLELDELSASVDTLPPVLMLPYVTDVGA